MMPGAGGAGAGGVGAGGEPSESSALLDPSAEPWTGGIDEGRREAVHGTPAGGPGLTLPPACVSQEDLDGSPAVGEPNVQANPGGAVPSAAEPVTPVQAGGGVPAVPVPLAPVPGRPRTAEGRDEPSTASALLEGGDAEWGADSRQREPAVAAEPAEEPLDDRVAMPRPATSGGEEDTSAWDSGSAMFAPLLWSAPRGQDDEGDGLFGPGYSSERRETWGSVEPTAATADGDGGESEIASAVEPEPDAQWATWRPSRTADTTGAILAGAGADVPLGCAALLDMDDEEEEENEDPEEPEAEEPSGPREIADLLQQDDTTWGTVNRNSALI